MTTPSPSSSGSGAPPFIAAADIERLPPRRAVDALREVLAGGFDPERDGTRTRLSTDHGQLLQMPSTSGRYTGTKILTLTPGNVERGRPMIQGLYALFGGEEQEPLAVLDGAALTCLRTPAVSALGAVLTGRPVADHLVLFGTGVQAWEHARLFREVFGIRTLSVVGRRDSAAQELAERAAALGMDATGYGADRAEELVGRAELIVCCTSSPEPLFPGRAVRDTATVIACGAHEPHARELDEDLMARARVCVESRHSALQEAGEVVQAIAAGRLAEADLTTFAELQRGAAVRDGAPVVVKTTGMPWQDLAVSAALYEAAEQGGGA